jgi:filamin
MHLKVKGRKIDDLAVDLADGVNLIYLLEQVSSKRLITSKNPKKPRFHSQKLENVSIALNFLKKEGINLAGIGAEGIYPA